MKLYDLMNPLQYTGHMDHCEITDVTNDTRKVKEGSVFVCIRGKRNDGHDFAQKALKLGARAVVCERDLGLEQQLLVKDTHYAYAVLCANFFGHPADGLRLVGITGTKGKTSSTYILKTILEKAGYKVGLIGSIQNMSGSRIIHGNLTSPEAYEFQSLLRQMKDEGCQFVVMEVSAHATAQQRVAGCRYEVAAFTNFSQDHLDDFGTMEAYFAAKKKLFAMCESAVINIDDAHGRQLAQEITCPVMTFSIENDKADFTAKNVQYRPDGVSFELLWGDKIARVRHQIIGQFAVYNAMTAAVCAARLGVNFNTIIEGLNEIRGVCGRVEQLFSNEKFTVIRDYAHSPASIENVLKAVKTVSHGRIVILFGCGGDRDRTKRPVMASIAAENADFVIITTDNPRTERPADIISDIIPGIKGSSTPYIVIENRYDAIRWSIENAQKNDIIILAGKGHETYQEINGVKYDFDESVVVDEILRQLKLK